MAPDESHAIGDPKIPRKHFQARSFRTVADDEKHDRPGLSGDCPDDGVNALQWNEPRHDDGNEVAGCQPEFCANIAVDFRWIKPLWVDRQGRDFEQLLVEGEVRRADRSHEFARNQVLPVRFTVRAVLEPPGKARVHASPTHRCRALGQDLAVPQYAARVRHNRDFRLAPAKCETERDALRVTQVEFAK